MTYPFVKARHFHSGRQGQQPIWVVLHTAETNELPNSAEGVANYFATTDRKASAHLTADSNSVVRSVKDTDTAFGAKGANNLGLHMEHAGRAKQTAAEWADAYSTAMLGQSAKAVALWCREFNIPVRFVDRKLLLAHQPGITTHDEVSKAFPGTGHWDPGPAFPMTDYLALVRAHLHPPEEDVPLVLKVWSKQGDNRLWLCECLTKDSRPFRRTEITTLEAAQYELDDGAVREVQPGSILDKVPKATSTIG